MLSYNALLDDATKLLYDASSTPRIDAEVLMQHVVQQPIAWLIAYGDTEAIAGHVKAFYKLVDARQQGRPIAYLTGTRDFWSLQLTVNESVLIPRADTETLVEEALKRLPKGVDLNVLDLGTGSGAIALSIAKERPSANVLAVDFSAAALGTAQENAELNKVINVEFLVSDWFSEIDKQRCFNLIASNPPYIESGDAHLAQGHLRFEPSSALVADQGGLSHLRHITQNAAKHLLPQGYLIVEHGYNQADAVRGLFQANGFDNVELFKDINALPRCTVGQLNS